MNHIKAQSGRTDFDHLVELHHLFPPLSKLFFGESDIRPETRSSGDTNVVVVALTEDAPAHEFGGGRAQVMRLEDFDIEALGEMREGEGIVDRPSDMRGC